MSKHNGNPLGFATVGNTTAGSFFAFITGATTVSGLFLSIFGLTSFSYILVGDPNVSMYTVLQGLSLLPNPLEFVRDCNSILVAFSSLLDRFRNITVNTGISGVDAILRALLSTLTAIGTILSYFFAFIVSVIILPFYLVYFLLRCIGCLLLAIGLRWPVLNIISQPWQPVSWLIRLIGGAL